MKKILAIGASNSQSSINRQLAKYTASRIEGAEMNLIDLNDFEMPMGLSLFALVARRRKA